jgi:hypothetical protein
MGGELAKNMNLKRADEISTQSRRDTENAEIGNWAGGR